MDVPLNEYELRVLGSLVEKQIATPDYYPLTINALTNACNQKNHRDPVVSYDEATVMRALESLKEKKLVYVFHGSEARVGKYGHLFPKSFELDDAEVACLCVLILRGPQTPGELRARTAHLHNFEQLSDIETVLQTLTSREQPLALKLPRQPGARESRYAHLLGDDVSVDATSDLEKTGLAPARPNNERMTKLENDVISLQQEVAELKEQFANFKKMFE